jgi:predicted RNA-binding Zn ribbon-like protein
MALEQAAAHSALRLMAKCQSGADADRLKICANCGWLFLDQSRNRSRVWCDMTVCGNRAKASRHYYRNREVEM